MKKNLKQALVPLLVMVFGAAAAFATNAAKQNEKADELAMFGYHYVATSTQDPKCEIEWVPCSIVGNQVCTIAGKTYYRYPIENGLQCTSQLYLD